MNVHDELSDDDVLRAASECLSERPVASPPDVESIMGWGRTRQRRRSFAVAGLSTAGLAAVSALALALTGVLGPVQTHGTINTVAYTLVRNSDGTATLTLNPGELFDPVALQGDLAQYGIPAKVNTGSFCSTDPAPAGFSQVVTLPGPGTSQAGSGPSSTITIDPAAMPNGTELSIGNFQLTSGDQQADVALIDASSYTCTSTPPTLGNDTPGLGVWIHGPASLWPQYPDRGSN
jgi:hypothetical protein